MKNLLLLIFLGFSMIAFGSELENAVSEMSANQEQMQEKEIEQESKKPIYYNLELKTSRDR